MNGTLLNEHLQANQSNQRQKTVSLVPTTAIDGIH